MRGFIRWRRRRSGEDFGAEIEAHVALETDRLVAEGWAYRSAVEEARRRFGNVGQVRERYYDRTHVRLLDDASRDIRFALRSLWKDRSYLFAAVAALGVGLAANVALFSLFASVALKPLPVPSPDRLVSISQVKPPIRFGPFSLGDFFFYRDNARSFSSMAAGQPAHLRLAGIAPSPMAAPAPAAAGAVAEPVIALFVTTNYFDTFGVRPIAGRSFRVNETGDGAYSALISENYWQRRFSRDRSTIGSTLIVSGIRANIVGVTPRDFAGTRQEVPDLWIDLSALGDPRRRALIDASACCEVVGRLAAGYTLQQSQGELSSLAAIRRQQLPPGERQMTVSLGPALSFGRLGEQVRPLFAALQVAMLLVLFVACANVASLTLGRAAARKREIVVRLATGAGRGRIIRQLFTEGMVVALAAGIVSAAVTTYALSIASRFLSAFLSREGGGTLSLTITSDGRVAIYVVAVSIAATIMFALAPSLQASRLDLAGALRTSGATSAGAATGRLRGFLIAGQIAVSIMLLVGAAGLARSAIQLVRADPGFRADAVLSVWLTNPGELGLPAVRARQIEAAARARIQSLAGVQSLAVASRVPLGGNVTTSAMLPEEHAGDATSSGMAPRYPYTYVSQTFFATMGVPILRGRAFTEQEVRDSARVTVISDSLARALWPRVDAIGRLIALNVGRPNTLIASPGGLSGTAEIIGIVGNVRGVSMTGVDAGDVYLPKLTNDWSSRILLRVQADPARVTREIPSIVRELEPALPVSIQPLNDVVASDAGVVTARVSAGILAAIGVIGLLLASIGVYGMVSYTVRQQQREIGIRMALGAHGRQVLAAALRGTLKWIAGGVVAGLLLGVVGIKLTNAVLAGASVSAAVVDPVSMFAVPLAIAVVAVLAASISARKAGATNPAVVLRSEA